jgi:hypothetical protein
MCQNGAWLPLVTAKRRASRRQRQAARAHTRTLVSTLVGCGSPRAPLAVAPLRSTWQGGSTHCICHSSCSGRGANKSGFAKTARMSCHAHPSLREGVPSCHPSIEAGRPQLGGTAWCCCEALAWLQCTSVCGMRTSCRHGSVAGAVHAAGRRGRLRVHLSCMCISRFPWKSIINTRRFRWNVSVGLWTLRGGGPQQGAWSARHTASACCFCKHNALQSMDSNHVCPQVVGISRWLKVPGHLHQPG